MEKYLTNECLTVGLAFNLCCILIFLGYILVLQKGFLKMINSIQQTTEALMITDELAIFNEQAHTAHEFHSYFAQLVIAPIHATLSFIEMFSTKKKHYQYTILLLKALNFPEKMNRIIEHRLAATKNSWEFVKVNGIIAADSHPEVIRKIISELMHPDTYYKIKNWKVATEIS